MKIQKFIVGSMGTNCYFLIGNNSDKCAVVDPGAEAGRIIQKLEEKKLKCTHILLTHAHFDHIMALETVREATGAPVFVHEADSEFLTDNDLNCMSVFSSEKIKINPAENLLKWTETCLRLPERGSGLCIRQDILRDLFAFSVVLIL